MADLDPLLAALPAGDTADSATPAAGAPDIASLLAARVASEPAAPFLTFYDDATGERTELSASTFDNWVAKTANLLVDGLDLQPGGQVAVVAPLHWQAAVAVTAAWAAGGQVVGASAGDLAVAFVAEEHLDAPPPADEVVGLSLRPLAGRLRREWPAVTDYAAEVPGYGDRFARRTRPRPADRDLVRLASATAARWGLARADRILVTDAYDTPAGLLGGLLAPLASGASAVLCRNPDPALLPRRLAVERVTAVAGSLPGDGPPPEGIRELAV